MRTQATRVRQSDHCVANKPELPTIIDNFIFWTERSVVLQDYYFNTARSIAPASRNHTFPRSFGLHMYVDYNKFTV